MIDVGKLRADIGASDGGEVLQLNFTRRFIDQVIAEIVAGREAIEELETRREADGRAFGLKPEQRL